MSVAVVPFRIQTVEPSDRFTFATWLWFRSENTSVSSGCEYWMLLTWQAPVVRGAGLGVDDRADVPLGARSLMSSQPFEPYA